MAAKTVRKIKLDSKKSAKKTVVAEIIKKPKPKQVSIRGVGVLVSPIIAIGKYIKGSWVEIRQVRWPSRSATWGMTGAVIIFTVFFLVIIVLLDGIFQWLFKEVLLK